MFFTEKTRCTEDYVQTENIYEVLMFSIFDITALLPHVGVPIMLYFIPAWHFVRGDTILVQQNLFIDSSSQNLTEHIIKWIEQLSRI